MKTRLMHYLILGSLFVLGVTSSTLFGNAQDKNADHDDNRNAPVKAVAAIPVRGNPITSADIAWVDPGTERYYFADRSNAGVDIIDPDNNVWVGRVDGMAG